MIGFALSILYIHSISGYAVIDPLVHEALERVRESHCYVFLLSLKRHCSAEIVKFGLAYLHVISPNLVG